MKKAFLYITVALSLAFIVLWQFLFADSVNYYIVSVVILIASMLPFFVSYEQKKVTARDITLTATLIALAVVSRAAFYLVPQVKPIAAVVIVSAVCLGAHKDILSVRFLPLCQISFLGRECGPRFKWWHSELSVCLQA